MTIQKHTTKVCSICNQEKDATAFNGTRCKKCISDLVNVSKADAIALGVIAPEMPSTIHKCIKCEKEKSFSNFSPKILYKRKKDDSVIGEWAKLKKCRDCKIDDYRTKNGFAVDVCWLEKECTKCGKTLSIYRFAVNKKKATGHEAACISCKNKRASNLPVVCKTCGIEKPADNFRSGKECKQCMNKKFAEERSFLRANNTEYMNKERARLKEWKAKNKEKVNEGHRRYYQRKTEREGREYNPLRFKENSVSNEYKKIRNARTAFRKFIEESSDDEAKCWYAATGKPWENPKLTESQKWSVRYRADLEFNAKEKARLYEKKMRRLHGIRIGNDGTPLPAQLINAKSCLYCGEKFNDQCKPTLDHMIPLIKGGLHSMSNLVVCCRSCNSRKGKRDFMDFIQTLSEPHQARALRAWHKLRRAAPSQHQLFG